MANDVMIEVWSELEANSGSREAAITELLVATISHAIDGTESLNIELPREAAAWDHIEEEKILRVEEPDGSISEWRIRKTTESRDQSGATKSGVEGEGIRYDLAANAELVERVESDGTVTGSFSLNGLTPSEHIDFIMDFVPSYFNKGTVDPTDEVNIQYDWDSPLSALDQIAKVTEAELEIDRQSDGTYDINLLTERGSAAEKAYFQVAKNIRSLDKETNTKDQSTRIYPVGQGPEVEPATIDDNAWEVSTTDNGANTVTFVDIPVGFDDQFDGSQTKGMDVYVQKQDGTNRQQVVGSTAPRQITVGDASQYTSGDFLRFVKNSSGDELTYLEHPVGVQDQGVKSKRVKFDGVQAIENLVTDSFIEDWTSGTPDFYDLVGSPPVEENNDSLFTKLGGSSARLGNGTTKLSEGEGIETDRIDIAPTAEKPYFSAGVKFKIVSGAVRLEIVDVTNGETYPQGNELAFSNKTGVWTELLAVSAPSDFNEDGTTQARVRVVADDDNTEFYLDGVTFIQEATAAQNFQAGRGSNLLWKRANNELSDIGLPVTKFSVDIADLTRLDPDEWPHDSITLGATVQVIDEDLGLDFSTRVREYERDLLNEANSSIQLSNDPDELTGFLGRQPVRGSFDETEGSGNPSNAPNVPPDIDASSITFQLTRDTGLNFPLLDVWQAEITWDAVARGEKYEVRVGAQGVTWDNATVLATTTNDAYTAPSTSLANKIGQRDFDILIKAIGPDGKRSQNASSKSVSEPAPDASAITSGDISTTIEGAELALEIDTTDTEATWMELHMSTTQGFTPSDTTFVTNRGYTPGNTVTFTGLPLLTAFGTGFGTTNNTLYYKFQLRDDWSGPLGEGSVTSSEFSFSFDLWNLDDHMGDGSQFQRFNSAYGDSSGRPTLLRDSGAGVDKDASNIFDVTRERLDDITDVESPQLLVRDAVDRPDPGTVPGNSIVVQKDTFEIYRNADDQSAWEKVADIAGQTSIDDLTDVNVSSPSNDDLLRFDSGQWVTQAQGHGNGLNADFVDGNDASDFAANPVPDNQSFGLGNTDTSIGNFWFEYDQATNDELQLWSNNIDGGNPGTASLVLTIPYAASPVVDFLESPTVQGSPIGGASSLDGLSDVSISSVSSGDYLRYDGSNFVNTTIQSADLPSHTHDTSDITSGTFGKSRLPSVTAYENESNTFNAGQVIGTDPGGTQDLRVGGNAVVGGTLDVGGITEGGSSTLNNDIDGDAQTLQGNSPSDFLSLPVADNQPLGLGDEGTNGNFWWEYDEAGNDDLELWSNNIDGGDPGTASLVYTIPYGEAPVVDFTETPTVNGGPISGVSDHGNLSGLGDDDHPQYAALAQNETVTGTWTFGANPQIENGTPRLFLMETDTVDDNYRLMTSDGNFFISRVDDAQGFLQHYLRFRSGGDISFLQNGEVIIGSDPGGSEILRVGGDIKTSGKILFTDTADAGNTEQAARPIIHHGTGSPSTIGIDGALHTVDA